MRTYFWRHFLLRVSQLMGELSMCEDMLVKQEKYSGWCRSAQGSDPHPYPHPLYRDREGALISRSTTRAVLRMRDMPAPLAL